MRRPSVYLSARYCESVNHIVPELDAIEPSLISRARRGEADAVAELYRLHSPTIFRYFYFRVNDRGTAEDLTGEVFVKMVEGLPRYEERGVPITAWLFRMAHDRLVDHHRRSTVRQTEELSDSQEAEGPSTEALILERAEMRRVRDLIEGLTEDQRTVIQMRFVEGYSLEETARLLKKTTGAVKALQHRALRHLGQRLTR